jgi:hypothetical protein
MSLSSHVSTASGQKMLVAEGSRLVFGRGPGVDLIIAAGRGLSRRAGLVTAMAAGVWIANISRTHALYVEGEGYQVRLPRMEHDGEPANGWFVHTGTALVGSRAMLDDGQSLMVTVTGQYEEPAANHQADRPDRGKAGRHRAGRRGRVDRRGLRRGRGGPGGSERHWPGRSGADRGGAGGQDRG